MTDFFGRQPTFARRGFTFSQSPLPVILHSVSEELSEEQLLLAGCRAQERAAQYRLYQRYKSAMFSSALRILGDRDLAQDALQEAFVDVFRQIDSFRQESTLGAWIKTIVVRSALRVLRREQRMEVYDQERHPEPLVAWHDNLTGEALEKAINELPAGYRAVFCLIEVEGYMHREVAEMLGISEGTSKSQLFHAKKLLQVKLHHLYA
jgi:RNA polymerase sigma-70 factor (ECF subfamily)